MQPFVVGFPRIAAYGPREGQPSFLFRSFLVLALAVSAQARNRMISRFLVVFLLCLSVVTLTNAFSAMPQPALRVMSCSSSQLSLHPDQGAELEAFAKDFMKAAAVEQRSRVPKTVVSSSNAQTPIEPEQMRRLAKPGPISWCRRMIAGHRKVGAPSGSGPF